jgi:hypothetical protein
MLPSSHPKIAHPQVTKRVRKSRVQIETMSAGLEVTQPREIAVYARAFGLLQQSAVYGKPARELIGRAIGELQEA